MNQKKNNQFYIDNEVRIGKDFEPSQPHYYSSLRSGFKNYFETYLDIKDSVAFLASFNWERENIGFNFKIQYEKVVSTILDFHRFFELFMKSLLQEFNPYLSVKIDSSYKDFLNFIIENQSAEDFRTVEFGETKKRLSELISRTCDNPKYSYLNSFKFLFDKESGIDELSWWRNRLTHNGSKIPNIISLDYLISQKIIPLIYRIIQTEKDINEHDYKPYYFETETGINIIERILNIKFNKKEFDKLLSEERFQDSNTRNKYIELYHLKNLGRANMNYDKFLKINLNTYNEYHRIREKDRLKLIKFQEQQPEYHKTNKCLCCGNKTLATFKEIEYDPIHKADINLTWCQCLVCDYGVSNKLGNPKDSNITKLDIFE